MSSMLIGADRAAATPADGPEVHPDRGLARCSSLFGLVHLRPDLNHVDVREKD